MKLNENDTHVLIFQLQAFVKMQIFRTVQYTAIVFSPPVDLNFPSPSRDITITMFVTLGLLIYTGTKGKRLAKVLVVKQI